MSQITNRYGICFTSEPNLRHYVQRDESSKINVSTESKSNAAPINFQKLLLNVNYLFYILCQFQMLSA